MVNVKQTDHKLEALPLRQMHELFYCIPIELKRLGLRLDVLSDHDFCSFDNSTLRSPK